MASGFTAFATILGGFISGATGIIVFLFRDRVEGKKEKKEWYSNIINHNNQMIRVSKRYEEEYCGRLVRDVSSRTYNKFQSLTESAPHMVGEETLELLIEISVRCHDISNTSLQHYEGGDKAGETHIRTRHENELSEVAKLCEKLNEKCGVERDEISIW